MNPVHNLSLQFQSYLWRILIHELINKSSQVRSYSTFEFAVVVIFISSDFSIFPQHATDHHEADCEQKTPARATSMHCDKIPISASSCRPFIDILIRVTNRILDMNVILDSRKWQRRWSSRHACSESEGLTASAGRCALQSDFLTGHTGTTSGRAENRNEPAIRYVRQK